MATVADIVQPVVTDIRACMTRGHWPKGVERASATGR